MVGNQSLSHNFWLHEFVVSETANKLGIDNTPPPSAIENLRMLCVNVLQPARDQIGRPFKITSGYRCARLNKAVGGVANSKHLTGHAADIAVNGTVQAHYWAQVLAKQQTCDKVIIEHKAVYWLHVQWSFAPLHKIIDFS